MKRQDVNVQVVNVIGSRRSVGFLGALMMLGLILWLWKFFLAGVVLASIYVVCVSFYKAGQCHREAILQRCDQQHAWVTKGDPRGTYGESYREPDWCRQRVERFCGPVPKPASERLRRVVDGATVVVRRIGGETVERHP